MTFTLPMMLFSLLALPVVPQDAFEKDVIKTTIGDIEITFIGHGSLMLKFCEKIIYIDPYSTLADYAKLPKADLLLITHEHYDHLDSDAIDKVRTGDTKVVLTEKSAEKVYGGIVMRNGDIQTIIGIRIEAVPAYNILHKRENGQPFHPKNHGNGYILTLGNKRMYIAGDTENTAEMKALKNIDIAFLPMNLPYTMSPEMVADAVKAFKPEVLYPYHYGDTDTSHIITLCKKTENTEVRIRKMK
ncbi:MAG TPA: MBL fold metallo-hydrolase [Nitrospirota bacterium]|nr:MBL fold metallo-hydrolase [Nitrospirota bacterium]